ncbi:low-density lipoprotein receptor-related protein 3 isoform X2 [Lemur catta]|uniref:low-density lipoprotein receptor-related protein 3 isoform X2 n=1 Tax=Lemur catta TaxID=9447 RepID=UPI001E269270|nr:low-density lipoprotein receptor-related protein 3 isoform X2 [Lemur catta]XP_045387721.1 low-density lipoprotein receptor-related protein 3 isoform X2 [Lemur catta]XP_045387722.1 low-density lipoprotein receptor-related protein 3 isoform X2 [Lemur catta]
MEKRAASGPEAAPGARAQLAVVCLVNIFLTGRLSNAVPALAACSGKLEQHTERRGVIYSPAWPLNYPPGTNCSWYIQGDRGDMITISFRNFDVEESHQCSLDWLLLGPAAPPRQEAFRLCGSAIPPAFISARDHVWIFFHSDASSSGQAQGFRLSYIRGDAGRRVGWGRPWSPQCSCVGPWLPVGPALPRCQSWDGGGTGPAAVPDALSLSRSLAPLHRLDWEGLSPTLGLETEPTLVFEGSLPLRRPWRGRGPSWSCHFLSPQRHSWEGEPAAAPGPRSLRWREVPLSPHCLLMPLCPPGKLGQASCQADEFRCDNGKCLPGPWQCNTVDECGDGSDEGNCSAPASEPPGSLCPGGTFPCSGARSTRCLPVERRCDGTQDCGDGSDEAGCPDLACGRRLGSFYGSFASPDLFGAARGPSDLHCTWLVDTQDPRRVLLQLELRLGYDDYVQVYEGLGERGDRLLQTLSYRSNHRPVSLEAAQGRLTVAYHARARSAGHGFNATYQVKGYCLPWEQPCGNSAEGDGDGSGDQGCFSEPQRCDGWWHCPSGRDEQGCPACPPDQYPCEGGSGLCYTPADRCNNQKSCPDGADEKNCFSCQPGTFHCGTNLCIFETWRCDGQEDCQDGSDEHGCLAAVPRKVITAALIGSLVCGLLLVIALGCAFKLYSLRTQEYRAFETQMTRLEAEFVRREAPPSYGQLIAQGLIPPVEDFPVYSASQPPPRPAGLGATEPAHGHAATDAPACFPQGALPPPPGSPLEPPLSPATGAPRPDPAADRCENLTDSAGRRAPAARTRGGSGPPSTPYGHRQPPGSWGRTL